MTKKIDSSVSSVVLQDDVPCEVRDGTVLRSRVYRPRAPGRYPVLLCRTPYGKYSDHDAARMASLGYIVAVQDCRGRHSSDGEFIWTFGTPGNVIEAHDGYDAVEWAASLDGCSGQVGMWGNSYPAGLALRAAGEQPPSLAALYVSGMADRHTNMSFGIFETGRRLQWLFAMATDARRRAGDLLAPQTMSEADDVWGRIYRGKYLWQVPLEAIPEEFSSTMTEQFQRYLREVQTDFWDYPAIHEKVNVPLSATTGWWDRLVHQINNFTGVVENGPARYRDAHRLTIGPWGHSPDHWFGNIGPRDYGPDGNASYPHAAARWFDHHIKGMGNGVEKDPVVNAFVVNDNRWHGFKSWPIEGTEYTSYFLNSNGSANGPGGDGTLDLDQHSSTPDRYSYDPRDPVMSVMGIDAQALPSDQAPLDCRRDVLVYQTPPLQQDLVAIGPVRCHLWASSSAPDTDFTFKLCEVGADGMAINLSYGIVRARYRFGYDREVMLDADEPQEFIIDLMPIGIKFLKGSRIRLDISSSDFPNFDRNHNTGKDYWSDTEFRVAKQTVFHGGSMPSRLILPVIRDF